MWDIKDKMFEYQEQLEKLEKNQEFINFAKENLGNAETPKEVEIKLFLKWEKTREEILEKHKQLQEKILEKWWKLIFDWEIIDNRYLDTPNKKESELKKQNIDLVRVRNTTEKKAWKDIKKTFFTIKSITDDWYSKEYEKEIQKENYWKELEEKYWLEKIKSSTKTRKEFKMNVFIRKKWKQLSVKKEVKIAFDDYEQDKKFWNIPPFFEIESDDEDVIKETIKLLSLNSNDYFYTQKLAEALLKDNNLKEQINFIKTKTEKKEKKLSFILNSIIENTKFIVESESIFLELKEFLDSNNKNNYLEEKEYEKLKKYFKRVFLLAIKKQLKENPDYINFFSRILDNNFVNSFEASEDKEKNLKNFESWKKFNDKFEREYDWYIQAFILNFLEWYKKNSEFKDFKEYFKTKIDIFLKTIFFFDDNLTKWELKNFLDKTYEAKNNKFSVFTEKVNSFIKSKDTAKLIDEKNYLEIINNLINVYRAGVRWVWLDKEKNQNKEWADIIQENLEKNIWELFSFLTHNFSIWLNVHQREDDLIKNYLELKKNFKEVFYYIYMFSENNIFYSEKLKDKDFNQNFVEDILKIDNIEKYIFDDKNFLNWIEKNCFKNFLENIFTENENILDYRKNFFKKYQQELVDLLKKNKENNNFNKKLDFEKIENNDINYDFWNKLNSDNRLKVFLEKIYNINSKSQNVEFNKELFLDLNNEKVDFDEFIKEEFQKKYWVNFEKENEEFKKYKSETSSWPKLKTTWKRKTKTNKRKTLQILRLHAYSPCCKYEPKTKPSSPPPTS